MAGRWHPDRSSPDGAASSVRINQGTANLSRPHKSNSPEKWGSRKHCPRNRSQLIWDPQEFLGEPFRCLDASILTDASTSDRDWGIPIRGRLTGTKIGDEIYGKFEIQGRYNTTFTRTRITSKLIDEHSMWISRVWYGLVYRYGFF